METTQEIARRLGVTVEQVEEIRSAAQIRHQDGLLEQRDVCSHCKTEVWRDDHGEWRHAATLDAMKCQRTNPYGAVPQR